MAAELASLPLGIVLAGALLLIAGVALAAVIGFRDSRRTGRGVVRSIGNGLR